MLAALGKLVVVRPRPAIVDPVTQVAGFSFPSGHAANAALMVTTCLVLVWPLVVTRSRRAFMALLGVAALLLTMADRVFLGVHYPSDVIAGATFGAAVVVASDAGHLWWTQRRNGA